MTSIALTSSDRSEAKPAGNLLLGGLSLLLLSVSVAINLFGYAIAHPPVGACPLTEMWRGVLLAVVSVGTAVPAGACAVVGSVSREANRRLALAGLIGGGGFIAMFFALWA